MKITKLEVWLFTVLIITALPDNTLLASIGFPFCFMIYSYFKFKKIRLNSIPEEKWQRFLVLKTYNSPYQRMFEELYEELVGEDNHSLDRINEIITPEEQEKFYFLLSQEEQILAEHEILRFLSVSELGSVLKQLSRTEYQQQGKNSLNYLLGEIKRMNQQLFFKYCLEKRKQELSTELVSLEQETREIAKRPHHELMMPYLTYHIFELKRKLAILDKNKPSKELEEIVFSKHRACTISMCDAAFWLKQQKKMI